jgi:formamidopyrimidine-DNA glycosylase
MSGKFEFSGSDGRTLGSHGRVAFAFEPNDGSSVKELVFDDARNFGTVRCSSDEKELEDKLGTLGPDILEAGEGELTGEEFVGIVKRLRTNPNVCKFLMNQKRLSGVGNYILAEGLYKANVDPWVGVKDIDEEVRWRSLVSSPLNHLS